MTIATAAPDRTGWKDALTSERAAKITSLIVFLVGWQILSLFHTRVPGPWPVVEFLWTELTGGSHGGAATGEFWEHFLLTVQRFLIGLAIGFTGGLIAGVLVGSFPLMKALFNDTVLVLLTLPAIIWAFLTVMWFGIDWKAPVLTVALASAPFVAVNIAQGVRAIPHDLHDMSTAFDVPWSRRVRHLIVAGVMGYLFAGLRFAVIIGWNGILLSEWFSGQAGVGHRARYWYDANRYRGFLGWVVLFIGFIVLLDRLVLSRLQNRAFRWRHPAGEATAAEDLAQAMEDVEEGETAWRP